MIQINLSNKTAYTLIVILSVLIIGGIVIAYNSGLQPSVMGHSAEEVEGTLAYVGSCDPGKIHSHDENSTVGSCTCGLGETIMILEKQYVEDSQGNTGTWLGESDCWIGNQGTSTVKGWVKATAGNYDDIYVHCKFSCFK